MYCVKLITYICVCKIVHKNFHTNLLNNYPNFSNELLSLIAYSERLLCQVHPLACRAHDNCTVILPVVFSRERPYYKHSPNHMHGFSLLANRSSSAQSQSRYVFVSSNS